MSLVLMLLVVRFQLSFFFESNRFSRVMTKESGQKYENTLDTLAPFIPLCTISTSNIYRVPWYPSDPRCRFIEPLYRLVYVLLMT